MLYSCQHKSGDVPYGYSVKYSSLHAKNIFIPTECHLFFQAAGVGKI